MSLGRDAGSGRRGMLVAALLLFCCIAAAPAEGVSGNLLRNGDYQEDWITLLPETKNHHWCYSSEFYHRRDYNPDGWYCKGSGRWDNADAPAGRRRAVRGLDVTSPRWSSTF